MKNKKYFVEPINSSKAYQFICTYHYSGASRQAVSSCVKRKGKTIKGKIIIWNESQE